MKKVEQVWTELGKTKKPKRTNLNKSKKIEDLGKELDGHIKEFQKHEMKLQDAVVSAKSSMDGLKSVVDTIWGSGAWSKKWDSTYDEMYYLFEEIGMFWTDSEWHEQMEGQIMKRDNLLARMEKIQEYFKVASDKLKDIY